MGEKKNVVAKYLDIAFALCHVAYEKLIPTKSSQFKLFIMSKCFLNFNIKKGPSP
jgi:hypothetical protein